MNDAERRDNGLLFNPGKLKDPTKDQIMSVLKRYNQALTGAERREIEPELFALFGSVGKHVMIVPPFYCNHGDRIFIGDGFYANMGLMILANAKVTFGNGVILGPRVSIYTPTHPIDPGVRKKYVELVLPVEIKDNVWVGGNVVINPGVTIGENSVIASGAVVTEDIPANCLAGGVPAKVIRMLSEEDRVKWEAMYEDYQNDPDTD